MMTLKLRASQSWIAIPLFLLSMVSFAGPIEDLESKNRILEEQLRQVQIAIAELSESNRQLKAKVTEQSKIIGEISGPIFRVIEGSANWNATPEAFRALGPDKMYVIRYPHPVETLRVPPFILSDSAPERMYLREAVDYCQSIGGALPTPEQVLTLSRAMTHQRIFDQDALPDFSNGWFWLAPAQPNLPDGLVWFLNEHNFIEFSIKPEVGIGFNWVRCVLPAVE